MVRRVRMGRGGVEGRVKKEVEGYDGRLLNRSHSC